MNKNVSVIIITFFATVIFLARSASPQDDNEINLVEKVMNDLRAYETTIRYADNLLISYDEIKEKLPMDEEILKKTVKEELDRNIKMSFGQDEAGPMDSTLIPDNIKEKYNEMLDFNISSFKDPNQEHFLINHYFSKGFERWSSYRGDEMISEKSYDNNTGVYTDLDRVNFVYNTDTTLKIKEPEIKIMNFEKDLFLDISMLMKWTSILRPMPNSVATFSVDENGNISIERTVDKTKYSLEAKEINGKYLPISFHKIQESSILNFEFLDYKDMNGVILPHVFTTFAITFPYKYDRSLYFPPRKSTNIIRSN